MNKQNYFTYKNRILLIGIIAIISVAMAALMINLKKGYYIDEYYTYTLANGTHLGIDIADGAWNDTTPFTDELIISEDTRFSFAQACANTADDVHPPLYYICVNAVSSLFAGRFSNWFAMTVNVISLIVCAYFTCAILLEISDGKWPFAIVAMAAYMLNPAVISNLAYFRMYFMLSAIAMAYAYVHIRMLKAEKITLKHLIGVYLLGVAGFMTHYYMLFVMFFGAFFFAAFNFFFRKKYLQTIEYAAAVVAVIVTEYLIWPICIAHMFIGYRGQGAREGLLDFASIPGKIMEFTGFINDKVFSGTLLILLVLIVAAYVVKSENRNLDYKISSDKSDKFGKYYIFYYPLLTALGYFLAVALTALDSNRFLFPMEGILLIYVIYGLLNGAERLCNIFLSNDSRKNSERRKWIPILSTAVIYICAVFLPAMIKGNIDYLYPERGRVTEALESKHSDAAITFQGDFYDNNIDEFIMFDRVYFAGADIDDGKVITDISDVVNSQDETYIFIENVRDQDKIKDMLLKNFEGRELCYVGNSNGAYDVFVLR